MDNPDRSGSYHHYHRNAIRILFLVVLVFCLSFYSSHLPKIRDQLLPLLSGFKDTTSTNAAGTQIYIVHVKKPGHMASASAEELEAWHKLLLKHTTRTSTLSGDSGEHRLVYSYHTAMSGFAAWLTAEEVTAMGAQDWFLYAHRDRPVAFETTHTPDLLKLRGSGGYWTSPPPRGNMGEGMIIGVIDSGINPDHLSFGDSGMRPDPAPFKWRGSCDFNGQHTCNNKLLGARNFVESGELPTDPTGHGTHVAGIAAGNFVADANINGYARGTAAGAAPRAHLAVYRAKKGSQVIKAIEQAIHDGVDVINISLTGDKEGRDLYKNVIAIGALAAVRRGILVVCAAGNDGPAKSTVQNDAPWILTVGASTTDRALRVMLELRDDDAVDGTGRVLLEGESMDLYPDPKRHLEAGLVFPGAIVDSRQVKLCNDTSLGGVDIRNKMVCCIAFDIEDRDEIVRAKGGIAVVLMNPPRIGNTMRVRPHAVPSFLFNFIDSAVIRDYLQSENTDPRVTVTLHGTVYEVHPYPRVSFSSGRGPSVKNGGGILKPDVLAPGVSILSASRSTNDGFVMYSGTSMATPHVSGIASLLKVSHKDWSPAAIKSAIMTSADWSDSTGHPITDQTGDAASFTATGAGHVDPWKAPDPGFVYDLGYQDYLDYLCGLGYTQAQVEVVAGGPVDCSTRKTISGEDLNYPSISVNLSPSAPTKTITRTARIVARSPRSFRWEVEMASEEVVSVMVHPKRLNFRTANEKKMFSVTFALRDPRNKHAERTVIEGQLKWVAYSGSVPVRSPLYVTINP